MSINYWGVTGPGFNVDSYRSYRGGNWNTFGSVGNGGYYGGGYGGYSNYGPVPYRTYGCGMPSYYSNSYYGGCGNRGYVQADFGDVTPLFTGIGQGIGNFFKGIGRIFGIGRDDDQHDIQRQQVSFQAQGPAQQEIDGLGMAINEAHRENLLRGIEANGGDKRMFNYLLNQDRNSPDMVANIKDPRGNADKYPAINSMAASDALSAAYQAAGNDEAKRNELRQAWIGSEALPVGQARDQAIIFKMSQLSQQWGSDFNPSGYSPTVSDQRLAQMEQGAYQQQEHKGVLGTIKGWFVGDSSNAPEGSRPANEVAYNGSSNHSHLRTGPRSHT